MRWKTWTGLQYSPSAPHSLAEHLPIYTLGIVATVCKDFNRLIQQPQLWLQACKECFAVSIPDMEALKRLAANHYKWVTTQQGYCRSVWLAG